MKKVLITGGTGFIGSDLCIQLLKKDVDLVLLTRNPKRFEDSKANNLRYVSWDEDLRKYVEEVDAVIHLAGEPVIGGRWTSKVKQRIYDSRIQSTRTLVEAMKGADNKPKVFISASASGYYGNSGLEWKSEQDLPGNDFLADVCKDWEAEAMLATELGVRVVIPRIGIVLGKDGGALKNMLIPFRMGLGGSIGSGEQFMSWIHRTDLNRAIITFLEDERYIGAVNMNAPEPVTMDVFTQTLAKTLSKPNVFSVPSFALKLAFGEGAQPILDSIRMRATQLLEHNFDYLYEDLDEALIDLV